MIQTENSLSYRAIERLRAEFKRLQSLTTYQRANERAADRRAERWAQYTPFTPEQLFDTPELNMRITIVSRGIGGHLNSGRSTLRGDAWLYQHYSVIHRPTEAYAIQHGLGKLVLDDDFPVIRRDTRTPERYCLYCRTHHPYREFIRSKRYLNEFSYGCKKAIARVQAGQWHWGQKSA